MTARIKIACAIVLGALCVASTMPASAQTLKPEKTSLTVGLIPSAEFLPLFVAQDMGFYKNEGLTVQAPSFQAGTSIIQALLGGALDIASGGATEALVGISAGRPIRIIWELNTFFTYSIVAKPNLKSWNDLKGKNIGSSSPGSQSDVVLRWMLHKESINPDADVKISPAGSPLARMATLKNGTLDAAVLVEPQATQAVAQGYSSIARARDLQPEWPSEVFYASEDFIKKNPNSIKAFLRAIHSASAFIRTHEKESVEVMVKDMKFPEADAVIAYKLFKDTYPLDGEFQMQGWDFTQDLMIASKDLPQKQSYDKVFDRQFVDWAKANLK